MTVHEDVSIAVSLSLHESSSTEDPSYPGIHDDDAVGNLEHQINSNQGSATLHVQRALALLLRGRYEQGWREYEWRQTSAALPSSMFSVKRWRGESLAGRRLLVIAEQGLGDSLQFFRYIPVLTAQAHKVVLLVPKSLKRLAHSVYGGGIVVLDQLDSSVEVDLYCPLMSLPLLLWQTTQQIPAHEGYLSVPQPMRGPSLRARGGEAPRVGLVWAGNPRHLRDAERSIPFRFFEPLLQRSGIRYFSFQLGSACEQLNQQSESLIVDLSSLLTDMLTTAELLSTMDAVITVDTAVAHLGGALGIPTWVMLPKKSDWRWGTSMTTTEWYQSVRLFRQTSSGDWGDVMSGVQSSLVALSAHWTPRLRTIA